MTTTFTYVRIPASEDLSLEECTASAPAADAGDLLPAMLKQCFADGRVIDKDAAQAHATRNFGAGKAAELDVGALQAATAAGSVETFALVRPGPSNGMCGVYLYVDEVGALKNLPVNRRAVALATACGFSGASFNGVAYVGRVRTQPVPARNVDFKVSDMDSNSEWLKRAATENIEYNMEMQRLAATMKEKGVDADDKSKNLEGEDAVQGYTWTQNDDDLEVVVDVPSDAAKGDIKVNFATSSIEVKVRGETHLRLDLYGKVVADECVWTLAPGKLALTLEKADCVSWAKVAK